MLDIKLDGTPCIRIGSVQDRKHYIPASDFDGPNALEYPGLQSDDACGSAIPLGDLHVQVSDHLHAAVAHAGQVARHVGPVT